MDVLCTSKTSPFVPKKIELLLDAFFTSRKILLEQKKTSESAIKKI